MKRFTTIAAALLVAGAPVSAQTLIVDGAGVLTGATGVDLGGTLYDVSFLDGSCIAIFDGCDSNADFDFATQAEADAAAQALLDQVFVGIFDDQPELTAGCSDVEFCSVFIPYQLTPLADAFNASIASNGNLTDSVGTGGATRVVNSTAFTFFTYATFSPSAVPEPSTWLMMLLGFGIIGAASRRRHSRVWASL